MAKYTLIKAHLHEGKRKGESRLIGSYIYKTDSHALALHQCSKDYPAFDSRVVLEALTFDTDEGENKEIYKAHEECGCVEEVYGW